MTYETRDRTSSLGSRIDDFHTPEYRDRIATGQQGFSATLPVEEEEFIRKEQEQQEQAVPLVDEEDQPSVSQQAGTILEAAFVDPAYTWPPQDGQGRNAIELQASIDLLNGDNISVGTTESLRERMKLPQKPLFISPKKWCRWSCCSKNQVLDQVALEQQYEAQKLAAKQALREYEELRREKKKAKERAIRRNERYNRVPEGILIYRLDTSQHTLTLLSPPHEKTDMNSLVQTMIVAGARPSTDKTRRGIILIDKEGKEVALIACEQRTAISWLEAIQLMLAKSDGKRGLFTRLHASSAWSKERLPEKDLDAIEEHYLNLANYSNKLIRAGALPGTKKGQGGAGGIYYSVEKAHTAAGDHEEEEALEAIAKRRAVIRDSWDFYRMICSLLRDRHKYDEIFLRMQLDSVYPYLNSMTGLNDNNEGYVNHDKQVMQPDLPQYESMTKVQVAQELVDQATAVMPSLVEICKALAGSLGMEEVGVGPVKEVSAAIRKADKKYNGDILKVTDYCRALLVVKDFPSLLALLELARDSFGPLIRRVKMSSLKADCQAKAGGYRDVIINVELKQHVCEIQVHLWPMWVVCGVDGFRHYRHCLEYSTDSFTDAYEALEGLDRKTVAELIVMAEEAVAETPLDNLEWYHEKYILDYFAEAGLFMKHDLMVWAEITFRQLIRLRTESPDIGPQHHETIVLYKYLIHTLQAQDRHAEAQEIQERVEMYEKARSKEVLDAERSLWDSFLVASTDAYDMIMDPNRKEREKEEQTRKEVKASKRAWRKIRAERFPFLDSVDAETHHKSADEKKVGENGED